jgi:hypothetical protein
VKGFELRGWDLLHACGERWEEGTASWVKEAPDNAWYLLQLADLRHLEEHHGVVTTEKHRYVCKVAYVDLGGISQSLMVMWLWSVLGLKEKEGGHIFDAAGVRVCDHGKSDNDGPCRAELFKVEAAILMGATVTLQSFKANSADHVRSRGKGLVARLILDPAKLRVALSVAAPAVPLDIPQPLQHGADPAVEALKQAEERYLSVRGWKRNPSSPEWVLQGDLYPEPVQLLQWDAVNFQKSEDNKYTTTSLH